MAPKLLAAVIAVLIPAAATAQPPRNGWSLGVAVVADATALTAFAAVSYRF